MLKHLDQKSLSQIMELADKILAKYDPDSLGTEWGAPRDPRRPDPDQIALNEKIANLSHDARMELMALM
jgi:hypothetical protein